MFAYVYLLLVGYFDYLFVCYRLWAASSDKRLKPVIVVSNYSYILFTVFCAQFANKLTD